MDSPKFDGCKKDCSNNWDVSLVLFLDSCVPEIELRFYDSIDIKALIHSGALNVLNRGTTEDGCWVALRVDESYNPIKIAHRISEWLTAKGCRVKLSLG